MATTSGGGATTSLSISYGYDRLYRLTSADSSADDLTTYTYDPVGNRLSKTQGGTTTDYTYDRADRIQGAGSVSYTGDANGNLVARGSDALQYDQANRLVSADVEGTITSYSYDGDRNRASRTVGTKPTVSYTYEASGTLPFLIDDGTRKYLWGLGNASTVDTSDDALMYHTDGLGSVRAITGPDGAVVQSHRTDEFGIPITSAGSVDQPLRYTSEQFDPETTLTYLRARYYDPGVGRFLTPSGQAW